MEPAVAATSMFGCQLMAEAVHDEELIEKLGCRIAVALEERFICAGWPAGQLFTSEQALCREYGVSQRIIREAVRVLDMRGTARLRKGSPPGLEITTPDVDLVVDVLRGYAYLNGVTEEHRTEALAFVDRVQRRLAGALQAPGVSLVLDFLLHFTRDQLTPGALPKGVVNKKFSRVRAGRIAIDIMDKFFARSFEPGRRISSEAELSAHFHADRSITRQAIRLMESAGMVASLPGRGNGIIIQRPSSGPVCRQICCYLAAHRMPVSSAFVLFCAMSVEAIALAASKADADDVRRLQETLTSSRQPGRSTRLSDIFSAEDSQFDAIRNPLINLYVRTIRGYAALTVAEGGVMVPDEVACCFADNTRRVFDAIVRHEPEAAARAHEQKLLAMRKLEMHHNPKLAGILYADASI